MKPSGHEAGHGTMSHFNWVNHIVGYILHTVRHASCASPVTTDSCSVNAQFLLVPYYSWRSTHHAHHVSSLSFPQFFCAEQRMFQKATMSIERDENYVPRTRTDYMLPPASEAHITDYHDIFEETPIYTLFRMLAMQALGWQFYLLTNAMGSPTYPAGTNVCFLLKCLMGFATYLRHDFWE